MPRLQTISTFRASACNVLGTVSHDSEDFQREFGARLRRLRVAAGLSQNALAQRLAGGTDASQVSRWERAQAFPSHANRRALADALGVPEARLFYDP